MARECNSISAVLCASDYGEERKVQRTKIRGSFRFIVEGSHFCCPMIDQLASRLSPGHDLTFSVHSRASGNPDLLGDPSRTTLDGGSQTGSPLSRGRTNEKPVGSVRPCETGRFRSTMQEPL